MPVAQLDRASVSEAEGLEFESRRARIFFLRFDLPPHLVKSVQVFALCLDDRNNQFLDSVIGWIRTIGEIFSGGNPGVVSGNLVLKVLPRNFRV